MKSSQCEQTREQFEPGMRHIRDILPAVLARYAAIEESPDVEDDGPVWTPWTATIQTGGELLMSEC
jgi:hypothetical protein